MYLEEIPENVKTTTIVKIKYDCHEEERLMKWSDANKNFQKNNGKHICRKCWLKSDDNPAKNKEIIDKIKKTNMEKYGNVMPMNSQENIEKKRQQLKDENFKEKVLEKRRKTSREKYGVDHAMHSEKVKEKQKKSMNEKYGVDHPYQSKEIMDKMRESNMEKYGVENVGMLPEVQEKMKETRKEKYGVEHYNQLPEMREWMSENCKNWLQESWDNPWAKGITRPKEWNDKQRETVIEKINSGTFTPSGVKGTIKGKYNSKKCKRKNPMFRSSYELAVHFHLDECPDVTFYDYEPFQVSYCDTEGKNRYYTVDFIIKYNDGRLLAVEVKNNYHKNKFLNNSKYKAFINECEKHGFEFEIWTNEKIKSLNKSLDIMLKSELVSLI